MFADALTDCSREFSVCHVLATALMPVVSADGDYGRGFAARSTMNRIAAVATTVLIAVWAYAMSSSLAVAVVAAWCWVFVPGAVKGSASADLAPVTLLSMLVLLIATELLRRRVTWPAFALVAGAILFVSHTRLEAGLVTIWTLWRVRKARIGTPGTPAAIGLVAVGVLAIVPLFALYRNGLAAAVSGWSLSRSEIAHRLPDQLSANASFMTNPHAGSPVQVALAMAALATRRGREIVGTGLLALAFFALYAVYPLGRFEAAGAMDGWRYALPVQLLCIPLAASGITAIASHFPRRVRPILAGAVVLILAALLVRSRPFISARHPAASLDRRVIDHRNAPGTSAAALIVTRSVAFSRILTRVDVQERCSAIADPEFASRVRNGNVEYLRTMGDREPPTIGDAAPLPVSPQPRVPPWLYRYQLGAGARHR